MYVQFGKYQLLQDMLNNAEISGFICENLLKVYCEQKTLLLVQNRYIYSHPWHKGHYHP